MPLGKSMPSSTIFFSCGGVGGGAFGEAMAGAGDLPFFAGDEDVIDGVVGVGRGAADRLFPVAPEPAQGIGEDGAAVLAVVAFGAGDEPVVVAGPFEGISH